MKHSLLSLTLLAVSTSGLAQPATTGQPSPAEVYLKRLDTNQDGKVDRAEYLKPFEAQFDAMDTNKDGQVNLDEFEAFARQMRERMLQRMQQHGQQ